MRNLNPGGMRRKKEEEKRGAWDDDSGRRNERTPEKVQAVTQSATLLCKVLTPGHVGRKAKMEGSRGENGDIEGSI